MQGVSTPPPSGHLVAGWPLMGGQLRAATCEREGRRGVAGSHAHEGPRTAINEVLAAACEARGSLVRDAGGRAGAIAGRAGPLQGESGGEFSATQRWAHTLSVGDSSDSGESGPPTLPGARACVFVENVYHS